MYLDSIDLIESSLIWLTFWNSCNDDDDMIKLFNLKNFSIRLKYFCLANNREENRGVVSIETWLETRATNIFWKRKKNVHIHTTWRWIWKMETNKKKHYRSSNPDSSFVNFFFIDFAHKKQKGGAFLCYIEISFVQDCYFGF